METIVRTEEEISEVINWAFDGINDGSHFSGESYEQGIIDMYDWLIGNQDHRPDED